MSMMKSKIKKNGEVLKSIEEAEEKIRQNKTDSNGKSEDELISELADQLKKSFSGTDSKDYGFDEYDEELRKLQILNHLSDYANEKLDKKEDK